MIINRKKSLAYLMIGLTTFFSPTFATSVEGQSTSNSNEQQRTYVIQHVAPNKNAAEALQKKLSKLGAKVVTNRASFNVTFNITQADYIAIINDNHANPKLNKKYELPPSRDVLESILTKYIQQKDDSLNIEVKIDKRQFPNAKTSIEEAGVKFDPGKNVLKVTLTDNSASDDENRDIYGWKKIGLGTILAGGSTMALVGSYHAYKKAKN